MLGSFRDQMRACYVKANNLIIELAHTFVYLLLGLSSIAPQLCAPCLCLWVHSGEHMVLGLLHTK